MILMYLSAQVENYSRSIGTHHGTLSLCLLLFVIASRRHSHVLYIPLCLLPSARRIRLTGFLTNNFLRIIPGIMIWSRVWTGETNLVRCPTPGVIIN